MADESAASPIFIVGANRSGTTLLRLILNAHSRIAIPEELIYFGSYVAGVPVARWRRPPLTREQYAAFVKGFAQQAARLMPGLDAARLQSEILNHRPFDLRAPYQTALETWARLHGKARWGEKTPGNLFYADVLMEMFPAARFIYVVRDPRAGVSSMQRASFFSDDVVFNALARRKHATAGRALLERAVPPARRMTLRYEDLVRAPEKTLRAVCAFLDEPYEPSMLRFHEEADAYMKPSAAATFNAAATRPISADKIDAWKDRLAPAKVGIVERVCAQEMREFGYVPIRRHDALPLNARLALALKTAYWHLQCWRRRDIRHYTVTYPPLARSRRRLRRVFSSED